MFKGLIDSDKGQSIVLGLSHANVRKLKKHDPILFNLNSLGLSFMWVCITFKDDEGKCAIPKGHEPMIALALDDECLQTPDGELAVAMKVEGPNNKTYRFLIFIDKDEQTMQEGMRPFIKADTKQRHHGFAPSDIPPSTS